MKNELRNRLLAATDCCQKKPEREEEEKAKESTVSKHFLVHPGNILIIAVFAFLVTRHWIPAVIISALYYSTRNMQIQSPNFGIIHFFGRAIRKVGPGLCVLFPGAHIDKRTGKEFAVSFGDKNVLTGEKNIGVGISGTVWLVANQELGDLNKLLQLPEDEAISKVREEANTTLEKEVAQRETVIKLMEDKKNICKAIESNVIAAMGGTITEDERQEGGAYTVMRVQIADTDAKTLTDAANVREQGKASAEAGESLKNALGKNAYIPQAVAEGGRALVAATANIAEAMANSGKGSNNAIDELNSTMKQVVEKLDGMGGGHV